MSEVSVITRDKEGMVSVRIDAPHLKAARRLLIDAGHSLQSLEEIDEQALSDTNADLAAACGCQAAQKIKVDETLRAHREWRGGRD